MSENKIERIGKAESRSSEALSAGAACEAIFWRHRKKEPLIALGRPPEGYLVSASVVPYHAMKKKKEEDEEDEEEEEPEEEEKKAHTHKIHFI